MLFAASCAPTTYTYGGVYVRNLSKSPITAILRADHGSGTGTQIEAGEKHVVGVFLAKNEAGTLEITDAQGNVRKVSVSANEDSGADLMIDFP